MCNITGNYSKKSFTGYKVAIKRDGKYYSPAMGIEYVQGQDVIIPKTQNGITFYKNDILNPLKAYYSSKMIGRTAVFVTLTAAMDYYREICTVCSQYQHELCIVEMTLSKDLMDGVLNFTRFVVAGKHIDKIEEICV